MFKIGNRYETKDKKKAREYFIECTRRHCIPKRALTLPSEEAICAKRFKEEFGCEVVGIDLGIDVVRFYDGDEVDHFYQGNVLDLGECRFRVAEWQTAVRGPNKGLSKRRHHIEPEFDMMFIDLTSLIPTGDSPHDMAMVNKLARIIAEYPSPHAIVGITFMRLKNDLDEARENEFLHGIGPDWHLNVHRYQNRFEGKCSEMLTAIYTR